MDTLEPTDPSAPVVPIPEYLFPTILEVAKEQVRIATDDDWDQATLESIAAAVDVWRATVAGNLTAAQTVTVVDLAIGWIEPHWPKNTRAVDDVAKLLAEARELIELRDRALAVALERGEDVVADDTQDPDEIK